MKPDVLAIAVSYRNDEEAAAFVSAVTGLRESRQRVLLVRNGAEEVSSSSVLHRWKSSPDVTIASNSRNLGYFGAADWALRECRGGQALPQWIVVCNTDISFPDPEIFAKLMQFYSARPPAVVAPDVQLRPESFLVSTGVHQNPHLADRPTDRKMRLLALLSRTYPLYLGLELLSSLRYRVLHSLSTNSPAISSPTPPPREIYAPFGAFCVFHRNYFESGGTLRYGSFLFGEEIFVAETLRRLGLRAVFDPRLRVFHHEHSAMRHITSRQRFEFVRDSMDYLLREFFDSPVAGGRLGRGSGGAA